MLGDSDAASDITQDVFIRLFEHQKKNNSIKNPKNWLFIAARNLCLNRIRDNKQTVNLDCVDREISGNNIPNHQHILLNRTLQTIPANCRESLILKEYYRLSYADIAQIMKITVPAVRSLLYKARNTLREKFKKQNLKR